MLTVPPASGSSFQDAERCGDVALWPAHFSPLLPQLQPFACRLSNPSRVLSSAPPLPTQPGTCLGSMCHEVSAASKRPGIFQSHLPLLPAPFSASFSCKLPSAGGWGFLVYQFPSQPSSLPHIYTQTQFMPFFPLLVFKGLRTPWGSSWGPRSASGES